MRLSTDTWLFLRDTEDIHKISPFFRRPDQTEKATHRIILWTCSIKPGVGVEVTGMMSEDDTESNLLERGVLRKMSVETTMTLENKTERMARIFACLSVGIVSTLLYIISLIVLVLDEIDEKRIYIFVTSITFAAVAILMQALGMTCLGRAAKNYLWFRRH
jgi:hypothetical protein